MLRYLAAKEEQLQEIAAVIKSPTHELVRRVEGLVQQNKALEQEIEALRNKLAKSEVQEILGQVQQIKGVPVLTAVVAAPDMDNLRSMVDMLRDKLGSGVILLGSAAGEKVNLVAAVTKDLMGRGLHAGNLVKEIAKVVGGGGGGRPDMAQAGGKEPSKLEEAIAKVVSVVEAQIK